MGLWSHRGAERVLRCNLHLERQRSEGSWPRGFSDGMGKIGCGTEGSSVNRILCWVCLGGSL